MTLTFEADLVCVKMKRHAKYLGQRSLSSNSKVIVQTDITHIPTYRPDCSTCTVKAKFHYASWFEAGLKLVADLQRAEIWPII